MKVLIERLIKENTNNVYNILLGNLKGMVSDTTLTNRKVAHPGKEYEALVNEIKELIAKHAA